MNPEVEAAIRIADKHLPGESVERRPRIGHNESGDDERCPLCQALDALGNALYFVADIHPDDRNEAIDEALRFYNSARPECQVAPSGTGFLRVVDERAADGEERIKP